MSCCAGPWLAGQCGGRQRVHAAVGSRALERSGAAQCAGQRRHVQRYQGFVVEVPSVTELQPNQPAVILDRCQDAGNVGSILRSASAFGFSQVIAIKGTAALWSPKVLRAGMGAHFGLQLHEGVEVADLARLKVPLACTSSHRGQSLGQFELPNPCAWVFGHEGQGVSSELEQQANYLVKIDQPGGEESLNVAAAAAICLHASASGLRVPL